MTYILPSDRYLAKQVTSSDLKRYLKVQDWEMSLTKRTDLLKYSSPSPINEEMEYYEVFVPLNEKISDFHRMIELAIMDISIYYNKTFNETLKRILYFGDTFEIGIISNETTKGAIPIPRGLLLYEYWRDIIAYGFCASLSPLTKKFSRKNREAMEYIEKSLIGYNLPGSFIATIHCPLPFGKQKTLDAKQVNPLGRDATLHILRGLQHLNTSAIDGNAEPIIKNYHLGLNYNMCSYLSNLIDISIGGELRINVTLEPAWMVPKDVTVTNFTFDASYKTYLEEAQEALDEDSDKEEPIPDELELEGVVLQLRRDPSEDARTIRLMGMVKEIPEMLSVKTVLNEDMYQIAIEAHKTQQKINIKGSLEKIGRFWYLRNPFDLRIKEEEPRHERALDKFE